MVFIIKLIENSLGKKKAKQQGREEHLKRTFSRDRKWKRVIANCSRGGDRSDLEPSGRGGVPERWGEAPGQPGRKVEPCTPWQIP